MTGRTCDTSVLLPALYAEHPDHDAARRALRSGLDAIPGHVVLESYSVLTRLPEPHRFAAEAAEALVAAYADRAVTLPVHVHRQLITELAEARISGGAVYDGLVAVTAREHDLHLLTRDRRARSTYDALAVSYSVVT